MLFDKFKVFNRTPNVEMKEEMTIVFLLDSGYTAPGQNRTVRLMEFLAAAGGDQLQVIGLHRGAAGEERPVKWPNLMYAPSGTDLRPFYKGRIVMWADNPIYHSTMKSAHPSLVIYDDREKGISGEEEAEMYEVADLVFSYDPDNQIHPKIVYIPSSPAGAIKALDLIQRTPNRKPPRQ
ncbi:hypothetical protein [Paenibacillus xylanexedens]|uniref:hypothetical protein n=1 Tax=Paenibacillus xylanexedens TaxID=528191 RepID=UPI0011A35F3E|nr:hypothetical protein [Paenibacillus xylanexedens]